MPCTGCLGPTPEAGDPGTALISALASLVRAGEEGEVVFDKENEILDGLVDPIGTLYKYALPASWEWFVRRLGSSPRNTRFPSSNPSHGPEGEGGAEEGKGEREKPR